MWLLLAASFLCGWDTCSAQQISPGAQKKKGQPSGNIAIKPIAPSGVFHPTCHLDSNSVGFYFFPANLGAQWTLRTVSLYLDAQNMILKSDTTYSFERVVSDSGRTLQGLPVLGIESSMPYHAGEEASVKLKQVEYYVDDSVVMTIFNHSMTSEQNHFLLVNPLKIGASWKDVADDTIRSHIIATDEPVSVPMGNFSRSIVVQTTVGFGELSKYFVPGVGIVKTIFRGIPPNENGTFVVTSELIALKRGNEKRSIKWRFQAMLKSKPIKNRKTKHSATDHTGTKHQ